jgi:sugar phosphate isomerase/epimerase
MGRICIQPLISNFDKYNECAEKNSFGLEIIDFAYPNVLDAKYKGLLVRYKKKLKNNMKLLSSHAAFIDLYINSPDPAIKKVSQERAIRNMEIAKRLGARYVVFHTNSLPQIRKKAYHENWVNTHAEFWKKITKKYKITVLLENMWDENPDMIASVVEKVGSKYLKVCFDTGHCNVFSKVPMESWFRKLGKNIVYIHINDNNGNEDSELPPGAGNIDWKKFDRYVKKYCSRPHVVLEVKDLNHIQKSVDYLKKIRVYPFL